MPIFFVNFYPHNSRICALAKALILKLNKTMNMNTLKSIKHEKIQDLYVLTPTTPMGPTNCMGTSNEN